MTERPPTFNELLIQEVQRHPELYDQQVIKIYLFTKMFINNFNNKIA